MGDRLIHNLVSSCGSHSNLFTIDLFSQPQHAARPHFLPELRNSEVISDTPLSPSHAGDKGIFISRMAGLGPAGVAVLPRPSARRRVRQPCPCRQTAAQVACGNWAQSAVVPIWVSGIRFQEKEVGETAALIYPNCD